MNNVELAPRYLESNHIQAISYAADASLAAYLGLAAQCASAGVPYFPVRPKLHALWPAYFKCVFMGRDQWYR